jgi:hypothetical protein
MVEIRLILSDSFVSRYLNQDIPRHERHKMEEEIQTTVLRTLRGNNRVACYAVSEHQLNELRDREIEKPAD